MQTIGTVESIWRYPVKGMAGESLNHGQLGGDGLVGDRIWAVQDVRRREIQSCKFRPQLLRCAARFKSHASRSDFDEVEVTLPDGAVFTCSDPDLTEPLSRLLGHDSVLVPLRPLPGNEDFYRRFKADNHSWLEELKATFTREPGEPLPDLDNLPPAMQEYVSIPGSFFLVSHFHILTTASLEHMQRLQPECDWAIARFRPNIVIATAPGIDGLAEQHWLGRTLKIGDIEIDCVSPAPRCGAVTRAQANLPADTRVLRSIVRDAEQNLGIYGEMRGNETISVGDPVVLI